LKNETLFKRYLLILCYLFRAHVQKTDKSRYNNTNWWKN